MNILLIIGPRPSDILLDIGGNTGKITQAYSNNCKEVVVLEPKRNIIEYGRSHRPNIKFVEGGAESIPLPDEYFDKVVASASLHHFSDQDKALEEMKRVLKSDGKIIILEIDPDTPRGKRLQFCETLFHAGGKLYQPAQLSKKVEEHNLHVLSIINGIFILQAITSENPQLRYTVGDDATTLIQAKRTMSDAEFGDLIKQQFLSQS